MSYQVLARKYRPRNFAEVVGQQHVLRPLTNALGTGRLHHAWLLTGTRGVGKTTIARILAKSLNCEQGVTATPCGQCSTCQSIEAGRFVDLLEIDAASRTKVEDTRELLDNVQYKPSQGRYKVYLIDEVHMLSKHSFNALLKTLEEPPEHVKFLLATTDPQKLPITVLSRCLQFNLKALSRQEIAGHLATVLQAEGIPFEVDALPLLARAAAGSMRDALSLTDQAIAQGDQQVSVAAVQQMLGSVPNLQLMGFMQAILRGQGNELLQLLDTVAGQVPDVASVLTELQNLLHQLALFQVVPEVAQTFGLSAAEQRLAAHLPPEVLQVFYDIVVQGRRDLPYAVDSRGGVEITLLRLLAFRPQGALPEEFSNAAPKPVTAPTLVEPPSTRPEVVSAPATERVTKAASAATELDTDDPLAALLASRALLQQKRAHLAEATAQQLSERPRGYQPSSADDVQTPQATRPAAGLGSAPAPAAASQPAPEPEPEPEPEPVPEPAPAAAGVDQIPAQVRFAREMDAWSAWVDHLEFSGLTRQIARHSTLQQQADGQYLLQLRPAMASLLNGNQQELIREQLWQAYGIQLQAIEIAESTEATPHEWQQRIDQQRLLEAKQLLADDPLVQKLQAVFAAQLLDDTIAAQ